MLPLLEQESLLSRASSQVNISVKSLLRLVSMSFPDSPTAVIRVDMSVLFRQRMERQQLF